VPDTIYDGLSKDEMIAFMQAFGVRATPSKETDHLILSSAGGWRFGVFLVRPNADGRFASAYLYASHDDRAFTVADANDWNSRKRFTKALYNKDGYPVIVHDLFLKGVSESYLNQVFTMWDAQMPEFMVSVGKDGGRTFVGQDVRDAAQPMDAVAALPKSGARKALRNGKTGGWAGRLFSRSGARAVPVSTNDLAAHFTVCQAWLNAHPALPAERLEQVRSTDADRYAWRPIAQGVGLPSDPRAGLRNPAGPTTPRAVFDRAQDRPGLLARLVMFLR
jgi:hypothetical protein